MRDFRSQLVAMVCNFRFTSATFLPNRDLALFRSGKRLLLSVRVTDQVGVEVVEVRALEAAAVAPPRIGLAVEAAVQEVERLIGKGDVAVLALPVRV